MNTVQICIKHFDLDITLDIQFNLISIALQ